MIQADNHHYMYYRLDIYNIHVYTYLLCIYICISIYVHIHMSSLCTIYIKIYMYIEGDSFEEVPRRFHKSRNITKTLFKCFFIYSIYFDI